MFGWTTQRACAPPTPGYRPGARRRDIRWAANGTGVFHAGERSRSSRNHPRPAAISPLLSQERPSTVRTWLDSLHTLHQTNSLGAYNTIGQVGVAPGFQGWFFAVQIQGTLLGDTNPSDWVVSQSMVASGTTQSSYPMVESLTFPLGPSRTTLQLLESIAQPARWIGSTCRASRGTSRGLSGAVLL